MKKLNKKTVLIYCFDAILVIAGTFFMGFAFNVFLNANQISPSGFAGLCSILSNVLENNFNVRISASIFYLAINFILFILSVKKMGVKFAINSALGVLGYSIFMEVANFNIGLSSGDLLLYAIYGGLLMGLGLGLVFRGHGSTGGSDMLANILGTKFRFLSVGNLVLIVDTIVLVLSFIAYGDLNLSLYSLIAIYIMTKVSDVIVSGVQGLRAYYIISENHKEISKRIMYEIHRGVTGFSAKGMYTNKEENVLMVIVTRAQAVQVRQIVAECDKNSFMYSTTVNEAMGMGFLPVETKKKKLKRTKIANVDLKQVKNTEEIANISNVIDNENK